MQQKHLPERENMKAFVMLVCINPNFLGCDAIFRDYFDTREECNAALQAVHLGANDAAACMYDPEHKK